MEIKDLKIGMLLNGGFREYGYKSGGLRIEYIAYDWAVARDNNNEIHLITDENSNINLYEEEKD